MTTQRTRRFSGQCGGLATKKKYGSEHYRRIGKMGGKARGLEQRQLAALKLIEDGIAELCSVRHP